MSYFVSLLLRAAVAFLAASIFYAGAAQAAPERIKDPASVAGVRDKARAGETLRIAVPALPEDTAFAPEDLPLNVVFEDADLAVLNKPAGLAVHPGSGNWTVWSGPTCF